MVTVCVVVVYGLATLVVAVETLIGVDVLVRVGISVIRPLTMIVVAMERRTFVLRNVEQNDVALACCL